MGKIVNIDCMEPHLTGELICLLCGNRYIGTWNAKIPFKDLYCPSCNNAGYLIGTGQPMEMGEDIDDYSQKYPRPIGKPGIIVKFPGGESYEES